jgi:iron complex outermembrane recepter protein
MYILIKSKTFIMKKLILITLFSVGYFSIFAQKISGKISLSDKKPAEFAVVLLLNAKDSSVAKTAVADETGGYELTSGFKNGRYLLSSSYVGYKKIISESFEVTNNEAVVKDLRLEEASNELTTLNVVARKPLIEVQADRTILNVDASISNAGANGLDLLRKAPGVVLDNNENIQLRGKNGVVVYLDGKRSYLSPAELANLLKSLNAADIEAIEVITNPSAKYDASGNAGIINIRLKKNKNLGTNGSVNFSTAYGEGPKNNISVNLNHRNKKINAFGNVGGGQAEWHNSMNLKRTQEGKVFDQRQRQINYNTPLNGKLGIDYFANSKHTFGFLANANTNIGEKRWESNSRTIISKASQPAAIDSILIASNNIAGNFFNANFNANYRFADTMGNEVTLDLDRGFYNSDNSSMQPNRYVNAAENFTFRSRDFATTTPSNIDIATIKGDYEHKFKKTGNSIATGFKYADVQTDNTFDFFNVINNQNARDVTQSNTFAYTEKVAALYLNGNYNFTKKLSLQAGLRYEHTNSIGDLRRDPTQPAKQEDYVNRKYDNFFPSAALTYNLTEKHAFNASYSRRIDRPNYEDLNPFEWRLDELTFRKGSPFLRPQYADNYELKYIFMGFATLGASYSRTTDLITDIVEIDATMPNKSFINYRNLASQDNYAINLSSPTPFKKWWNGYMSVSMFKAIYKANFPEYSFTAQTPLAWNVYCEQTFTLPKDFTYEISGWFNSSNIWGGSWVSKPQGSLDMGVQKKILKKMGSIKLSVTDIFFTAPWRSYSDAIPGLIISGNGAWESRQVKLNFNYRFGKTTVKGARNRKTGLEDEKNRIKG